MNTKQGLIGVIVPVYKVEKYIAECIESILAQTYTNFRLIIVDDGSPDGAGKMCDEYAKKDSRITVIHQENAGVTRARARGVEEADDCEFITFVDGDDTIPSSALYCYIQQMDTDTDIVISPADEYVPTDKNRISAIEYRKILMLDVSLCNSPWGKLFRRHLFDKRTFCIPPEIVLGEDLLMNIGLAFKNKKEVSILPLMPYNYRIHSESAMHIHKRDIKFEEIFYKHLRDLVPNEEWPKYAIQTIDIRLQRFRRFCGYQYNINDVYNSSFYKELRNDIKISEYKITGIDKILFYSNNVCIRFFAINYRKLINTVKNFIDYVKQNSSHEYVD